jgi:pyridoxine 5-phosphate synthase
MSIRLHINVDHVATLRNARGTPYPDPVEIALLCEQAGADGITAHLREDRRHILDQDIRRLRAELTTLLNLECAATPEMLEIAREVVPDVITLVPERRLEVTTEGGLDVLGQAERVLEAAKLCREQRIKLSLFIEASVEQVRASVELGAQQVELHTGHYCLAEGAKQAEILRRIAEAAALAAELGLEVAAGHGLTRHNLLPIARIPQVSELNIGHAVIADAVAMGIEAAVRAFRESVERGQALRSAS